MKRLRRERLRALLLYWCVIPTLVAGGGLVFDRLFAFSPWASGGPWTAAAFFFLVVGLSCIFRAERDLARYGSGTPSPFRPARRLVTAGIYGICRHPMFLGYDLVALSLLLFLRSPSALCITFPVFCCWQLFFLAREERILALRFGREFDYYRRRVAFLLPGCRRNGP